MILKEIADIFDDWLNRIAYTLLTYCDRNFWHYRNIAKNYAKQFECTAEQLKFFEENHLDYRTDLYYVKLAKLGNSNFQMFASYYFRDLRDYYENIDKDIFEYYNELYFSC